MELSDYKGVLQRWRVLIIAGTLVAALIGYRIALRSREAAHPLYAATASVVVNYVTPPGVPYIPTLSLHTQTDVLSARVQDPGELSRVAVRAHVALSQVQRVSTALDPQKPLITIQVLGTTPRAAAAVAQGLAQYLAGAETQQVQAQVASLSRTAARAMAQAQQRWQEAQTHYYLVCNCVAGQHQAQPRQPPTAQRTARPPSTRPAPQPSRQSRQQISRRPAPPLTRQPRHQVSRQPLRSPSRRPAPRRTRRPPRSPAAAQQAATAAARQTATTVAQQTASAAAHQTATAVASSSPANGHHRSSPGGQRRGAPDSHRHRPAGGQRRRSPDSHRGHQQQLNRRPAPPLTRQPRHQVSRQPRRSPNKRPAPRRTRQPRRSRSRQPAPRLIRQPLRSPVAAQKTATVTAHQMATAVAQQTATAVAQQTAAAAAQQAAIAAAQQMATAAAQQTATAGAQQVATAVALQTASAAAQQTATAVAQQTATAVAQQTAAAAAQQTATAAAQQMATAVAQQTATAAAQHTATAVALQTASAAAHQTATAVAEQTATAADQQTAIAAAQQTVAAADQQTATATAEQTAIAAAEQTATVEPGVSYIPTLSLHTQTDVLSTRVQDPGVLSRLARRAHVALSQVQRVSTAVEPLITIQVLGTTPRGVAVVAQRPAQYLARGETQQVQAQVASLSRTAASAVAQVQQRWREAQTHYYLVCNCVAGQHQAQPRQPPTPQRTARPLSTRPPQQLSRQPADPATLAQLRAELDLLQADYAAAASRYAALQNNPVPVATVLPGSVSSVQAPAASPLKAVLLATVVGFVLSSGLAMLLDYTRSRLPALARARGPGHTASPLPAPPLAGAKGGAGSARRAHAALREPEPAATLTPGSARPVKAVLLAAGLGLLACMGLAALLLDGWTMPLSVASHLGARRVRVEERRWPQAAQLAGPRAAPPALPALLLNPNAVHFNHHDGPTRHPAHTIYVVNVGPAPVTIRTITITGADRAAFTEVDTCTRSAVGVYGRCTISVRVAPMARGGPRRATLVITANAPGSPQRVPLSA